MGDEDFVKFMMELNILRDNRAMALHKQKRDELTDRQRIIVLEEIMYQLVSKVAKVEYVTGSKKLSG